MYLLFYYKTPKCEDSYDFDSVSFVPFCIWKKIVFLTGIENYYILKILNCMIRIATGSVFILIGYFGYKYLSKREVDRRKAILSETIMIVFGSVAALLNGGEVGMNDNALYNPILFYLGANLISWGVIILIKNINIKNNIVHFGGEIA